MPIKYNNDGEGNCIQCGKPLKEELRKETYRNLTGNHYGYMLYCSYRCVNDAQIKRSKQRRKESMSNLTCLYCKKIFNGKRKDTKFCSIRCRVAHFRTKDTPPHKTKQSTPLNSEINKE